MAKPGRDTEIYTGKCEDQRCAVGINGAPCLSDRCLHFFLDPRRQKLLIIFPVETVENSSLKKKSSWVVVAYVFNASTREAKVGRSL